MGLIVIAAAGAGSRFTAAGYSDPKPKIIFQDRSLLEWSLVGILPQLRGNDVRVVLQRSASLGNFVMQTFLKIGAGTPEVVEIDGLSRGQSDTVLSALNEGDELTPLTIWNVDTYVAPGTIDVFPSGNWLHLFPNSSPSMSFARLDAEGMVVEVAEKRVISHWASSGLYGFKTCGAFTKAYERAYRQPAASGLNETYVAPLYNTLLAEGQPVSSIRSAPGEVIALGTPEDLSRIGEPTGYRLGHDSRRLESQHSPSSPNSQAR